MATLILEDGTRFDGTLFGKKNPAAGEVVFTTGMIGYQETLTDPASCGQIVVMTYPLIGNAGINDLDDESAGMHLSGLVVSELCDLPSNWQMKRTLSDVMEEQGVTGLQGVDTRALTRHIREHGVQRGLIVEGEPTEEDLARLHAKAEENFAARCTCKEAYTVEGEGGKTVAVLDLGAKKSLLKAFENRGCTLKIYPAETDAKTILDAGCDGVFITHGPGSPEALTKEIETVRQLMAEKPVFGTGLGHLLMALAQGGKVIKLKAGHHGASIPVKDLVRGTCGVAAQHCGWAIDANSLPQGAEVTHINWNDRTAAGLKWANAFSVEFEPQDGTAPREAGNAFDDFMALIERSEQKGENEHA